MRRKIDNRTKEGQGALADSEERKIHSVAAEDLFEEQLLTGAL